jgi:hypothetical protein
MQDDMMTLKLKTKEAFLLFKLMGMNSFIGYTNPYHHLQMNTLEKELLNIKNNLLLDRTLIEIEGKLCIEPFTYSILQACKLSESIAWLHMDHDQNKIDSYYYISSRQIVEVVENNDSVPSSITFTVIGDHVDFFTDLENKLFEFDITDLGNPTYEAKINLDTYRQLLNSYDKLSYEEIAANFTLQNDTPQSMVGNFIHALKNQATTGQLVFMSKSSGVLGGIRFVLSDQQQWILTENPADDKELTLQSISADECLKQLFNTYIHSFKSLKREEV